MELKRGQIVHEPGTRILTCRDCDKEFAFPPGEQRFFREKGLSSPSRCKPCRRDHREKHEREQARVKECRAVDSKSTLGDAIRKNLDDEPQDPSSAIINILGGIA